MLNLSLSGHDPTRKWRVHCSSRQTPLTDRFAPMPSGGPPTAGSRPRRDREIDGGEVSWSAGRLWNFWERGLTLA